MNPSRAFGPQLVGDHWANGWVWYAGPLLGAAVAALLYQFLYLRRARGERIVRAAAQQPKLSVGMSTRAPAPRTGKRRLPGPPRPDRLQPRAPLPGPAAGAARRRRARTGARPGRARRPRTGSRRCGAARCCARAKPPRSSPPAIGLEPNEDARLMETDAGDWTDRPFADVQAEDPELFASFIAGDPTSRSPAASRSPSRRCAWPRRWTTSKRASCPRWWSATAWSSAQPCRRVPGNGCRRPAGAQRRAGAARPNAGRGTNVGGEDATQAS